MALVGNFSGYVSVGWSYGWNMTGGEALIAWTKYAERSIIFAMDLKRTRVN